METVETDQSGLRMQRKVHTLSCSLGGGGKLLHPTVDLVISCEFGAHFFFFFVITSKVKDGGREDRFRADTFTVCVCFFRPPQSNYGTAERLAPLCLTHPNEEVSARNNVGS